tara:strand:- start:267 stop:491 length:225 start_codon:yes stop_codon:yes gene_type:complete
MQKLKGLKLLILNAVGFKDHATHLNLGQALEVGERIQAEKTLLTHINHQFDFEKVSKELPEGVELAIDGMRVNF